VVECIIYPIEPRVPSEQRLRAERFIMVSVANGWLCVFNLVLYSTPFNSTKSDYKCGERLAQGLRACVIWLHELRFSRCDKLGKFAGGFGSSEVIGAADMLLADEDVRDSSLTGFLAKVVLDDIAVLALIQFVDLHRLVFAEVELIDDALCTTAVGALRLGKESDKVFIDRVLDEILCRGHCRVCCETRGRGSRGGEWVGNAVEDGPDGTAEKVHIYAKL